MSSVNLLPAYRVQAAMKRRTMLAWSFAITGYTALLLCACAAFRATWIVEHGASETLVELQAQLAAEQAGIRTVTSANRRSEAVLKAASIASDHPDWSIVLAMLAQSRGDGVKLEQVSMTPVTGKSRGMMFKVTGVGATRIEVASFVANLEEQGLFDSVVAVETRAKERGESREYSFELSCEISESKTNAEVEKP